LIVGQIGFVQQLAMPLLDGVMLVVKTKVERWSRAMAARPTTVLPAPQGQDDDSAAARTSRGIKDFAACVVVTNRQRAGRHACVPHMNRQQRALGVAAKSSAG